MEVSRQTVDFDGMFNELMRKKEAKARKAADQRAIAEVDYLRDEPMPDLRDMLGGVANNSRLFHKREKSPRYRRNIPTAARVSDSREPAKRGEGIDIATRRVVRKRK